MEKDSEQEHRVPFKISRDKEIDWDSLTIRVQFKENLPKNNREKIENTLENWAEKGIDKGYGGNYMHYLDDEVEWNEKENWAEFFVDMGQAEEEIALSELFGKLSGFKSIREIKLGSGYTDW